MQRAFRKTLGRNETGFGRNVKSLRKIIYSTLKQRGDGKSTVKPSSKAIEKTMKREGIREARVTTCDKPRPRPVRGSLMRTISRASTIIAYHPSTIQHYRSVNNHNHPQKSPKLKSRFFCCLRETGPKNLPSLLFRRMRELCCIHRLFHQCS